MFRYVSRVVDGHIPWPLRCGFPGILSSSEMWSRCWRKLLRKRMACAPQQMGWCWKFLQSTPRSCRSWGKSAIASWRKSRPEEMCEGSLEMGVKSAKFLNQPINFQSNWSGLAGFQSSNSSSWPQLLGKNPFDAELLRRSNHHSWRAGGVGTGFWLFAHILVVSSVFLLPPMAVDHPTCWPRPGPRGCGLDSRPSALACWDYLLRWLQNGWLAIQLVSRAGASRKPGAGARSRTRCGCFQLLLSAIQVSF